MMCSGGDSSVAATPSASKKPSLSEPPLSSDAARPPLRAARRTLSAPGAAR